MTFWEFENENYELSDECYKTQDDALQAAYEWFEDLCLEYPAGSYNHDIELVEFKLDNDENPVEIRRVKTSVSNSYDTYDDDVRFDYNVAIGAI